MQSKAQLINQSVSESNKDCSVISSNLNQCVSDRHYFNFLNGLISRVMFRFSDVADIALSHIKFKDFVHKTLDDMGIEKNPNGKHTKEGCRIGDRLDIVKDLIERSSVDYQGIPGSIGSLLNYLIDSNCHQCHIMYTNGAYSCALEYGSEKYAYVDKDINTFLKTVFNDFNKIKNK